MEKILIIIMMVLSLFNTWRGLSDKRRRHSLFATFVTKDFHRLIPSSTVVIWRPSPSACTARPWRFSWSWKQIFCQWQDRLLRSSVVSFIVIDFQQVAFNCICLHFICQPCHLTLATWYLNVDIKTVLKKLAKKWTFKKPKKRSNTSLLTPKICI
jgi:hypothetical protein